MLTTATEYFSIPGEMEGGHGRHRELKGERYDDRATQGLKSTLERKANRKVKRAQIMPYAPGKQLEHHLSRMYNE